MGEKKRILITGRAGKAEAAFHDLARALKEGTVRYSRDRGMPIPSKPFASEVTFGMGEWEAIQALLDLHPAEGMLQRLDAALEGLKLALEIGELPETCTLCPDQQGDAERARHAPACPWSRVQELYGLASGAKPATGPRTAPIGTKDHLRAKDEENEG